MSADGSQAKDGGDFIIGTLIAVYGIVASMGGCMGGQASMERHMRTEAVKWGAAEWVVSDDGSTLFRWKGEER